MAQKTVCDVCNKPIEGDNTWPTLRTCTANARSGQEMRLQVRLEFRAEIPQNFCAVGEPKTGESRDICVLCGLKILSKALHGSRLGLPDVD